MANPLATMLGYGNNPLAQALSPYSNTLLAAGLGLLSGRNWQQGLANAAQGIASGNAADQAYAAKIAEARKQDTADNLTVSWLAKNYPQYAGLPPAQGWEAALRDMGQQASGAGQESWFGNLVPLTDAQGNVVGYGQASNRGHFKKIDTPDGLNIGSGVQWLDTGTGYVPAPRYGGPGATVPVGAAPVTPAGPALPGASTAPAVTGGAVPIDNAGKAFQSGVGKAGSDRFDQYQKDAESAYGSLNQLDIMSQQMQDPNFYSGAGGDLILNLKRAAVAFGADPNSVSSIETFNAAANKATLDALGGSLGAQISDSDRTFIRGTMANLSNTPAGNRQMIEIQRKIAQRKIEVAQLAAQYVQQNGSLDANWPTYLNRWVQQNPLFSGAPLASGGGQPTSGGFKVLSVTP